MNEERALQTMPIAMGRVKTSDYTTYWVCVPAVQKPVPARVTRNTAFQKAKRRRQMLKKIIDYAYAGMCLGCIVLMAITLLNMAEMF